MALAKRLGLWLLAVLAAAAVLTGLLWSALTPPGLDAAPREALVLDAVTIVSPTARMRLNQRISIEDGRIAAIMSSVASGSEAAGDSRSRFVLPGLIDMHAHLPPRFAPGQRDLFLALFLLHGVTSIRDVDGVDGRVLANRGAATPGDRAAPRVFSCGKWIEGDPPAWPWATRGVATEAEAREAVRELDPGASCVKVLSSVPSDLRAVILEEAHARGLRVAGHLPPTSPWTDPGVDEVQHVCDPHCWRMGLSESAVLVETSRARHLAHTPTLVVYDRQLAMYEDGALGSPAARLLPRVWREVVWNPRYRLGFEAPSLAMREARRSAHAAMVERVKRTVRALHEAGVEIYAGSDVMNPLVVPGESLQRELRLLVEAGLTPAEAWNAASGAAGRALGEPKLGVIEPGAPADLLLFRENPLEDLAALSSLEAVIVDGRFYSTADLRDGVDAQLRHFAGPLYDRVSMSIARTIAEAVAAPSHDP